MNGYLWLAILAVGLVTIPQYERSLVAGAELQSTTWTGSPNWLRSAECARTTGLLLVDCPDGRIIPFAATSFGDDPGHALFLGAFSLITQKQLGLRHISWLNSTINFAGLALIAALLFALGARVSALATVTIGAILANDFHAISPHPPQLGEACFAAVLPIVILAHASLRTRRWVLPAWIAIGLAALAVASLLRQSIGLMGIAASTGAVAMSFWLSTKRLSSAGFHVLLLVGIAVAGFAPVWILDIRDALYDLPPTDLIEQHGIAHNLYLGLGVVDNAFGIEWLDSNADQAAKRIDPNVTYVSKEYYDILGAEYLRLLVSNPIEVLRIYFEKLWILLGTPLGGAVWAGSSVGTVGLLLASLLIVSRIRLRRHGGWYAIDAVAVVCAVFVGFLLLQGAIFHPSMQYAFPIRTFYFLLACVCVEYWIMLGNAASKLGRNERVAEYA